MAATLPLMWTSSKSIVEVGQEVVGLEVGGVVEFEDPGVVGLSGEHAGTASLASIISTPKSMYSHQHSSGEEGYGPRALHRMSSSGVRQVVQT